jgi:hypothetical protein
MSYGRDAWVNCQSLQTAPIPEVRTRPCTRDRRVCVHE